jgi:hypothetical protein
LSSSRSSRVAQTVLWLALALLIALSIRVGSTGLATETLAHGVRAMLGLAPPLERNLQAIVELRVWRALCTSGVGAGAGALGRLDPRHVPQRPRFAFVDRSHGRCEPRRGSRDLDRRRLRPQLVLEGASRIDAILIPLFSFVGAAGTCALVAAIASARGRVSVTTLLLVGIAVNMCVAGIFAAIQYVTLEQWEVSKAILAWTFGTLDDRSGLHCATVGIALLVSARGRAVRRARARSLEERRGGRGRARRRRRAREAAVARRFCARSLGRCRCRGADRLRRSWWCRTSFA